MARISYAAAVAALKAGDRIMVTNPDPTKAGDIRRFHMIGAGGGADLHHVRQAAGKPRARRGRPVPGRAIADIRVGR